MPFIRERPFWVKRRPIQEIPYFPGVPTGLANGRSVADGYARGWGLEFGDLRKRVLADPLYIEAMRLARGRTVQDKSRRANLFLLLKFCVPKLPQGDIVEFGSFRGGSAFLWQKSAQG